MIFEKYFELIDELSSEVDKKELLLLSKKLSSDYREGISTASSFSGSMSALSYFFTRFPATYAVSRDILSRLTSEHELSFNSLLDIGAGIGSFSLAANDLFEDELNLQLVEENSDMINLSKKVFSKLGVDATWHSQSYLKLSDVKPLDIVCFGYTLTELSEDDALHALDVGADLFNKALIVLEPGTKSGYQNILKFRDHLISKKLHILMPCPHENRCPLSGNDWCHFSKRLPRHSLHKYLKQATLGHEDEKFSYLVVTKKLPKKTCSRVLMPSKKRSGLVDLKLCNPDGSLEEKVITKKNKNNFKTAKKASWGDCVSFQK